jgi:hypothetical protein
MPLGTSSSRGCAPATRRSVDRQVTMLRYRLLTIRDVSVKHTGR